MLGGVDLYLDDASGDGNGVAPFTVPEPAMPIILRVGAAVRRSRL